MVFITFKYAKIRNIKNGLLSESKILLTYYFVGSMADMNIYLTLPRNGATSNQLQNKINRDVSHLYAYKSSEFLNAL